jgi:hypothetical protein
MKRKTVAFALLAAALACMAVGIAQGDYKDTLHKAAAICLECIGIG